ncbi:MAG TPA: antirestriction protein ArdA [Candidatus Sulfopaludibacter sp.]|nr:antirestriction protein ArdA [Candidatus Sulfopaludibacter sp.]
MKNSNYDLQLTCTVTYKEHQIEFQFDPYNDCTSLDGLKEMAVLELQNNDEIEAEANGIDENEVEIEITDFEGVPDKWAKEINVWEFAEAFAESEQEMEVIEAALNLDINQSDIDEAFQGIYKDDKDFAYQMAQDLGAIDKYAKWPNNCIDWDKAASELMYDYSEYNGYYFRQL